MAGKSHPGPAAPFPDPVNDWSHAVTAGTIIYSSSALVIRGVKEPPGRRNLSKRSVYENGYIYSLVLRESSHRDGFVAHLH